MSFARDQHRRAMQLAEKALQARAAGDCRQARTYFREALECERLAAEAPTDDLAAEPTRSVLFRSAATLALDCGELREAERLVGAGLAGHPPDEIAEELRQLLVQVDLQRKIDRQAR